MPSRIGWIAVGFLLAIVALGVGGYVFVREGGVPMGTTERPLPLEMTVARLALRASLRHAADQKNPLPFNDANMVDGAHLYGKHCAVCHGTPGHAPTTISSGMFPSPPQLFETHHMVTDDAEGITYWKVTHGIRLSGMPGFGGGLSDTERWQLTMLVKHADEVSPTALSR